MVSMPSSVLYWGKTRYIKESIILWLATVSHWVLDAISHRPDLPLYPGSETLIGFGLWNSLYGTLVVEGAIFIAGIALYVSSTKSLDKAGSIGLWSLILLLSAIYIANLFGPPPPDNSTAIAFVGLLMWLIVVCSYWVDKHRVSTA